MPAELENGFFARQPAWHGLGITIPEPVRSAEALVLAGLDWTVEKKPLYTADGATPYFANVRSSDGKSLGVVQKNWVPLDNVDAFAFTDSLVDSGDLLYETAGSLRDGRWVWMLAKMPGNILVAGQDPVNKYLLLSNGHDGTRAVTCAITPIRVVCQNTLTMALGEARQKWSVRHLGDLDGKLIEARRTLELSFQYFTEFEVEANRLAQTTFSDSEFEQFLVALLPVPTDGAKDPDAKWREGILNNYEVSTTFNGFKGSKWGALQAVTEYGEHMREYRSPNAQVMNNYMGTAAHVRDRAFALLAA